MFKTIVLVGIGGAIGSMLRYLTTVVIQRYYAAVFPLATLLTNVIGCFLIGVIVGWLAKHQLSDSNLKWILITGFAAAIRRFQLSVWKMFH